MTDITTNRVPTERLKQIAHAIADGNYRELTMRIPAEPDRDADLVISAAADEIDRLSAELAEVSQWLGNLLAIIHRDGGHYQAEHGTEKACTDAETAVYVLRGSLDGYVEAKKGELDDALEDARKYAAAQAKIARLREALSAILYWHERGAIDESWLEDARAALAEVPK